MYVGMPPAPRLLNPAEKFSPTRIAEIQAALVSCMGHIGAAAKKCGTSRSSLLRWIHQHPALEETLADIREEQLDTICLKTTELAMKGVGWAVERMLKSKMGRDRGFGEHVEVEHTGNIGLDDSGFKTIVQTLPIAELQALAALQDKLDSYRPPRVIPGNARRALDYFAEDEDTNA